MRFDTAGLPLHDSLILELDLYILRTWDGNASGDGPDLFTINDSEVGDLLRATFSNSTSERQSYPNAYPRADSPAFAGASAISALGYAEGDAIYRLRIAYPHTGARIALTFSAELRDIFPEITNESWAVDNIRITTVAAPPASATIIAGEASAAPGETILIPISLRNVVALGSSRATAIRTRLRYNASILMPISPTPKGVVEGAERVIDLELPTAIAGDSTIARLNFRVVVGNDTATALTLESTSAIGGEVAFVERAGTFRVRGLCEDGGTRLVDATREVLLRAPSPNPIRDRATVEIVLKTERPLRLDLVNGAGIIVRTPFDGIAGAGTHAIELDVTALPAGRYQLRLASSNGVQEVGVVVVR